MPHRLIMVVEDDAEDRELLEDAMMELQVKQKRLYFNDALAAYGYLKTTKEELLVIISDINMPGWNGIEFKRKIDEDNKLKSKCVPFVFFSTSRDPRTVKEAYKTTTVQGYFQKPDSPKKLKSTVATILDYWKECERPNF